jgi:hypothetical protein
MSICAIGIDSDSTIVHFLRECRRQGAILDAINLRRVASDGDWRFTVGGGGDNVVRAANRTWNLAEYSAVYCRLINLSSCQEDPRLRDRWHGLMVGLGAWLDTARQLVVKRPAAGASNGSRCTRRC